MKKNQKSTNHIFKNRSERTVFVETTKLVSVTQFGQLVVIEIC